MEKSNSNIQIFGKIYGIKNKINHKLYIGQTIYSIKDRLKIHFAKAKNFPNRKFYKELLSYGLDCFETILIEDNVPLNKINERERFYIAYYKTVENGYNTTAGGDGRNKTQKLFNEQDIVRDLEKGVKYSEIAEKNHVNVITIERFARGKGFSNKKVSLIDCDILRDYIAKGYTEREIANILNTGTWNVRRAKQYYNLQSRDVLGKSHATINRLRINENLPLISSKRHKL